MSSLQIVANPKWAQWICHVLQVRADSVQRAAPRWD
jgi:hypothetical protein